MNKVVRTLKDGYWDRTTVVRGPGGELRVRKESREGGPPGPWAHRALRNEIRYLRSLPANDRPSFPSLLAFWDDRTIGYEIPFYEDRDDFSSLLLGGRLDQDTADAMQRQLAGAVIEGLHRSPPFHPSGFTVHLREVLTTSIDALGREARFRPLTELPQVRINGSLVPGLQASLRELLKQDLCGRFEATPPVLLHGDLILENILWSPLLLIDPVSVAGLDSGPPLFDLVKYESFATGELYAIREQLIKAGPVPGGFHLETPKKHPALEPFRKVDLLSTFRGRFEREHGEVDPTQYALLDAYFSLVMALNTTGRHQWARVIKGCQSLAHSLSSPA